MLSPVPPHRRRTPLTPAPRKRKPVPARKAAIAAARALDAMKAADVVVVDVNEISPITELLVLATGDNPRHVRALAQEVLHVLKDEDIRPLCTDGVEQGTWAVVDYGPVVVHVFLPHSREFYDLEMLWGDGKKVRWKAPARAGAAKAEADPGDGA